MKPPPPMRRTMARQMCGAASGLTKLVNLLKCVLPLQQTNTALCRLRFAASALYCDVLASHDCSHFVSGTATSMATSDSEASSQIARAAANATSKAPSTLACISHYSGMSCFQAPSHQRPPPALKPVLNPQAPPPMPPRQQSPTCRQMQLKSINRMVRACRNNDRRSYHQPGHLQQAITSCPMCRAAVMSTRSRLLQQWPPPQPSPQQSQTPPRTSHPLVILDVFPESH